MTRWATWRRSRTSTARRWDWLDSATGDGWSGGPGAYTDNFGYDAVGNITVKDGRTYQYQDSDHPHAMTCAYWVSGACAANESYAYDDNGNLTSGGGRTITWTAENQVATVTQSGVTESYLYNADGERIKKTTNGVTTFYFGGGMAEETVGTGLRRHAYTFGGQTIAERDTPTSGASTFRYLHGDHLGSVGAVSTSNTSPTVTRQHFTPWGEARHGNLTATTDRNYTGQRKDDTGLLFYNARYYDAKLSRFISADTIAPVREAPQTRNRYAYTLNNPLRYTDPTGHCTETPNSPGDEGENKQCHQYIAELNRLGVNIVRFGDWLSTELAWILEAIRDLMNAAGWGASDFIDAMGGRSFT